MNPVSKHTANVCSATVNRNLCIGCGVCAGVCPSGNLAMQWTSNGQWQPVAADRCQAQCHICMDACPFVDHETNEDTLATRQYASVAGIRHNPKTGYYLAAYAGHAGKEYRERGASGGITSWLLATLLEQGYVDHVICVRPAANPKCLFEYTTLSNANDIRASARSAYYPVEMSNVLQCLARKEGRYAIVALPCVAKAIRLACTHNQKLASRITHVLGLVCGQTKSRYFTEYCAIAAGGMPEQMVSIEYRKKFKNDLSKAGYECTFRDLKRIERKQVLGWERGMGKAWGNLAFTPRPCLFCDDVFAETADCALMDAWLPEYASDWLGTNIILVRDPALNEILSKGATSGELTLNTLPLSRVIESQSPVLHNKREDIWLRLRLDRKKGRPVPAKRHALISPPPWPGWPRIATRMRIQAISHELWSNRKGLPEFLRQLSRMELWPSRIEELGIRFNRLRHIMASRLSGKQGNHAV